MNKITGFSVLTTGEGERVTLSYSVLDADGNIVSTNNRKNYVVLDEDVLTAIAAIRTAAAARAGAAQGGGGCAEHLRPAPEH